MALNTVASKIRAGKASTVLCCAACSSKQDTAGRLYVGRTWVTLSSAGQEATAVLHVQANKTQQTGCMW